MAELQQGLISEIHAARRLMLAGEPTEALEKLDDFADVEFATLSLVRGECLYVLRRFREAVAELKDALLMAPNSPRTEILLELTQGMADLEKTMRPAPAIHELLPQGEVIPISPIGSISPIESSEETEEEEQQPTENEIGLVSETLANIMVKQGKFDDARKVYIQLSRLNPDRYPHYRDRMEDLDKLQIEASSR
jgi:tetratricopeptide (TPR) repeat protein